MNNLFSIISKSRFSFLLSMHQSFIKHSDKKYFHHVLLIDDCKGYINEEDHTEFIFYKIEDLFESDEIQSLYKRYNAFHLASALKPKFALSLFKNKNISSLVYLDTDLYFCDSIKKFEIELKKYNALFTPHLLLANNNVDSVSQRQILFEAKINSTGLFNMGFFGLNKSEETIRFLQWWYHRNKELCNRENPGIFDDQKWIDSAFIFFQNFGVFRHLGYNVSWWNLFERPLSQVNNKYYIQKDRLVFFHFSQVNLEQEIYLSSYYPVLLDHYLVLKHIYIEYKNLLLKNNWVTTKDWMYTKTVKIVF